MTIIDKMLPLWQEIPAKLRRARKQSGETNASIAERTGMSKSTMDNIFSGLTSEPGIYKFAALCVCLGLSADELLGIPSASNASEQEHQLHDSESNLAHARLAIGDKDKQLRRQRSLICILLGIITLALVLLTYIVVDALHPNWGFFVG